jgi:centractin
LFSAGDKSGVILESGEGITQTCVVYEGYAIPHSYLRYDFGGRHVTEYLQTLLKRVGYSFNTTSEFEIVKKIKETLCYTAISSVDDKKIMVAGADHYILPDGNSISLKEEKILAPEILFNPSMIGLEYLCIFIIMLLFSFP